VVSPVNAYVYTEYIRPRLQPFIAGSGAKASPLLRATYASCLATLAHSSSSILDMLQALRADGSIPSVDPEAEDGVATDLTYQHSFDVAKLELLEHFEAHTKALLTDPEASVRRAFLGSVTSLCVFFGSSKANDVILSHLNTYLNDKDWILKCAFFQTVVGVATFVGGTSLEEFILPLMIQALTDPEDFVVEKVLTSFASMAELGLFQRSRIWEMVDVVARFMMHPNIWIREAAAHFISASTKFLQVADLHCVVSPLLQPYLKSSIMDYAEINILDSIKRPLPRQVLESAVLWALKGEGGLFWKPAQQQRTFSFGSPEQALPTISSKDLRPNALSKIAKNSEDEQWIRRLQNIGMSPDDEFKLLALREYIWRVAHKRPKIDPESSASPLTSILRLKEMNVTPQTIFFETQRKKSKTRRRASAGEHRTPSKKDPEAASHTITDALLDASTTIDDPLSQRKKPYANARKERLNGNLQPQPIQTNSRRGSSNLASPLSTSLGDRIRSRDRSGRSTDNEARRRSSDRGDNAQSDGTLTPTDSSRTGNGRNGGVKHKSSAINLLNRRDTSKTVAETGTTSTNAFGKVDGPFTREPSEARSNDKTTNIDEKRDSRGANYSGHTYDGNDPSVIRLLDSLASENYPHDIYDFGPTVTPISSKSHMMTKADPQKADKHWRPEGTLVATFGEHTGPINRVLPSPDHAFFITGSDDRTVKVWDTLRLERNLVHRSRQTHSHAEGAKVKCLCFVENTHTFVSGATDGSIHVVKVDYHLIGNTSKYGKLRMMREYQLARDEYGVWMHNWKSDSSSILLIATNRSRVLALDLRKMALLYSFQNPVHHGTLTCFYVDEKHNWMLLGTSHGVLDLWDLRFHLRLKAWGLGGGTPIHRLIKYPFKAGNKWICVAGSTGQTDITVWDVEKIECRQVYRAGVATSSNKENLKVYEPWKVDDEKPEGMLGRFATAIDPSGGGGGNPDRGIRALAIGVDSPDNKGESKHGFFVTGGADRKLRCWDISRPDLSTVISGLDTEENQPKFSTSQPTTSLVINTERIAHQAPSAPNAAAGASSGKKGSVKQPRSTIISAQQQQLLRSHLDSILDVCLLESPVGMTVSVDRMGCVYVFQ
jgi:phosphoinositide-3-kinase regulatory subunit 4